MNQKTFLLKNVRFLQRNANKSLFNVTINTNYQDLIDFESQMYSVTHITSSVVLRKCVEIDLTFIKDDSAFSFEERKLYSLVLEAYKYCKNTNKIIYIMRQINIHEDDDSYDDIDTDNEGDEIVDTECIHNIFEDLRTTLENLHLLKKTESERIETILEDTKGEISIQNVNRMNQMLESIS